MESKQGYGINYSSFQLAPASEKLREPFGGKVQGYLIYSPEGWVSATLMKWERPGISQDRGAINDIRQQLQEQPALQLDDSAQQHLRKYFLAADGYIRYSGRLVY